MDVFFILAHNVHQSKTNVPAHCPLKGISENVRWWKIAYTNLKDNSRTAAGSVISITNHSIIIIQTLYIHYIQQYEQLYTTK
jgi:hypothetical protein